MIVYHGTTRRRAEQIRLEGFKPKKPSRKVWFAESRRYAEGRAKTQAHRAHDRPAVLTCNLDINRLREQFGARRVFYRNGIVAIDAAVPISVLRSQTTTMEQPVTPDELAQWVNGLLRLKPHKGVGCRHPGIERLWRWVINRLNDQPRIHPAELLEMARKWLPEFFEGVTVDPQSLHVHRTVETMDVGLSPEDAPSSPIESDPRQDEALESLASPKPRQRVRGLSILAKIEDLDLFEWCAMCLDDESTDVVVAALRTMLRCEEGDHEVILPLADSKDKRVRAAATAALAKHAGENAPYWFERGLKDPSTCVRMEVATLLPTLDPATHRLAFELARHDPNPEIARRAERLTTGKGYQKVRC